MDEAVKKAAVEETDAGKPLAGTSQVKDERSRRSEVTEAEANAEERPNAEEPPAENKPVVDKPPEIKPAENSGTDNKVKVDKVKVDKVKADRIDGSGSEKSVEDKSAGEQLAETAVEVSSSLPEVAPPGEAPPLPSEAPPPPPPPEEDEKPPLPPVPSLPPFVPPTSLQGSSGTPSKAPSENSSSTPLDRSTEKSQSGSPRKPSVSPISLGSSPTPFSRSLTTQTSALATPELPEEPLQPREHKPRCIDAFEIIDQIGEGTYGKVRAATAHCMLVSSSACPCVCVRHCAVWN